MYGQTLACVMMTFT